VRGLPDAVSSGRKTVPLGGPTPNPGSLYTTTRKRRSEDGPFFMKGQQLGAALLEDEGNFIDHSKSSAFVVEEHEF